MHRWHAGGLGFLLLAWTSIAAYGLPFAHLVVSSSDFNSGNAIPAKCAMRGGNLSPELKITVVRGVAMSLVIIVEDPDAPAGPWTHWLAWNIPATAPITTLAEGKLPDGAVVGKNSFGNVQYDGPAPPSGTHRYYFTVIALDASLSLPAGSTRDQLTAAMKGHIEGQGELYGTYSANP